MQGPSETLNKMGLIKNAFSGLPINEGLVTTVVPLVDKGIPLNDVVKVLKYLNTQYSGQGLVMNPKIIAEAVDAVTFGQGYNLYNIPGYNFKLKSFNSVDCVDSNLENGEKVRTWKVTGSTDSIPTPLSMQSQVAQHRIGMVVNETKDGYSPVNLSMH